MERVVTFIDDYIMAAEILEGVVKVAAIDCTLENELCESFEIWTMPQLLIFSPAADDKGDKFLGPFDHKSVIAAASEKMPHLVSDVTD